MPLGTVYVIRDGFIIDNFDCDYEIAMSEYFNRTLNNGGRYFVTRKDIPIPYKRKEKILKNIIRKQED